MDEPQFEAQNLKIKIRIILFSESTGGFSGAEPAQGQFEVSDKTDLDLEMRNTSVR